MRLSIGRTLSLWSLMCPPSAAPTMKDTSISVCVIMLCVCVCVCVCVLCVCVRLDWERHAARTHTHTHTHTHTQHNTTQHNKSERVNTTYSSVEHMRKKPWGYITVAPKEECRDMPHLEKVFQDIVDKGGEGIILRDPSAPLQAGRSPGYLKHKV